jgi:hypothetical protein
MATVQLLLAHMEGQPRRLTGIERHWLEDTADPHPSFEKRLTSEDATLLSAMRISA